MLVGLGSKFILLRHNNNYEYTPFNREGIFKDWHVPLSVLSSEPAIGHMRLLSTRNVVSLTKKLNILVLFNFH